MARLIHPEPLNRAIADYTITHIVTPAYRADPELKSLEAEHPGIIDAMVRHVPMLRPSARAFEPAK